MRQKNQNDSSSLQNEIKHLREEKVKLEKEIKDAKEAYDAIISKNRALENVVESSKKNEVSGPDVIYINSGKTEHSIECMICFLE